MPDPIPLDVPLFVNWRTGQPVPLDDYYISSVLSFGTPDNNGDYSALFQKVFTNLGQKHAIWIPRGNYPVNNLTIPAESRIFSSGANLIKNANGPVITMGDNIWLSGLSIRGSGAIYTGKGIDIVSGNDQRFLNVNITDCEDFCLDIANDTALRFQWIGGTTFRTTTTNDAIRVANGSVLESNGDRTFISLNCAGARLMHVKFAQNTIVHACDFVNATIGKSSKTMFTGNRIATLGGAFEIDGTQGSYNGNIVAGDERLLSGATLNELRDILADGNTIDDDSGLHTNTYWNKSADISASVSWKADTADPAIGNGTIVAYAQRDGRHIVCSGRITMGSTTTFGTGNWYIQLPAALNLNLNSVGTADGSVFCLDSGTALFTGTSIIFSGGNKIYFCATTTGSAANFVNSLVPITWANGDYLDWCIRFPIQ